MINRQNIFKKSVKQLNGKNSIVDKESLTPKEKERLKKQTQMYILLKELIKDFSSHFEEGEEIIEYFPFTNEENSAIGTNGPLGMMYVNSDKGKEYVKRFNDLRGNRLLIATNKRLYFFVVLEYIEEKLFYSHPYEEIEGILLKKHKVSYFEWKSALHVIRGHSFWYTLDFQSGPNVFTDTLTAEDGERFLALSEKVPEIKQILERNKVKRKNKFDYIFSNMHLAIKVVTIAFIAVVIALLYIQIHALLV